MRAPGTSPLTHQWCFGVDGWRRRSSSLAGIALLSIQQGWKFIDKRLNRKVAVRNFRAFFQDWETSTENNAADPAFQFVAHEMKIRRMKGNITVLRPHLSGEQASDITELISGHEAISLLDIFRRLR